MQACCQQGICDPDGAGAGLTSANLTELKLGSLTLDPTFDGDVTEYATTTTNATNTLSYAAESETAEVTVKLGGVEQESSTITWATGENTLTLEVVDGTKSKTYTVTVTAS